MIRQGDSWRPLQEDELLREREFKRAPLRLAMQPPVAGMPVRIVFGREPVDKAFVLTLSLGEASAAVRADGVGHFQVE